MPYDSMLKYSTNCNNTHTHVYIYVYTYVYVDNYIMIIDDIYCYLILVKSMNHLPSSEISNGPGVLAAHALPIAVAWREDSWRLV